jgi:glycosyltransferase involved in cell wall biosynthesis
LGAGRKPVNPNLVFNENIHPIGKDWLSTDNPALYYLANSKCNWAVLQRELAGLDVDVVVNSNLVPSAIASALASRKGIPQVYDLMEYYPQSASAYFKNPFLKILAGRLAEQFMRYVINGSVAVITVSNSHAKMIRKMEPSKQVYVLPNGVELDRFRSPQTHEISMRRRRLSKELRLVYVGSVDEWLDFETPLKAIQQVKRAGFKVSLTVVGGSHAGFYLEHVKSLVKSYGLVRDIAFTGFVPYEEVSRYLWSADVAIAPYRRLFKNDVTPLKVLEYLASRKIVLCTPIPEIVNRFGRVLYTYRDAEDMQRNLEAIARNPVDFQAKVAKAEEIIADYTWDKIVARYYEIISSVAKGEKRGTIAQLASSSMEGK